MGHRLSTEEEAENKRAQGNLLNIKAAKEDVRAIGNMVADEVLKRDVKTVVDSVAQTNAAPQNQFDQRLKETMLEYGAISEALPYPTVNPMILKQRRRLQKRADGWARLSRTTPSTIKWNDNLTTTDMVNIWKQQKSQFIGDIFSVAMPNNIDQVNQLARATHLDYDGWKDMLDLHVKSREDVEYKKKVFDLTTAIDDRNAADMIPSVIRSVTKRASTDGVQVTRQMVADAFLKWKRDLAGQGIDWPNIASKGTIDAAMETFKAMNPAIETVTWWGPKGFLREEVLKTDVVRQKQLIASGWSTKSPAEGKFGLRQLALPTITMVDDVRPDQLDAYKAALKHFHIPYEKDGKNALRVGQAVDISINTAKDQRMFNDLKAAGAMTYDPSKPGSDSTLFGSSGAALQVYNRNNPVQSQYYQDMALQIGGSARHVGDQESASRIEQGRLNENHLFTLRNSQAQARDLYDMTSTMRKWIVDNPTDFGVIGSIKTWAQTWSQLGQDAYMALEEAGILPTRERSLALATETITEISAAIDRLKAERAALKSRGEAADPTIEEAIETQEFLRDQWVLAKKGGLYNPLNIPVPGAKAIGKKLGLDNNPRLVQIQVYELGMATTLARLRTTKDRLLKDIYTAAREATKMHSFQSAAQALYKMQDIGMQARKKYFEYERRINPQVAAQKYDVGRYGHVVPYEHGKKQEAALPTLQDVDLEALFKKEYPKK